MTDYWSINSSAFRQSLS